MRRALSSEGRTNSFEKLARELYIPAVDLDRGSTHVFGTGSDEPSVLISVAVQASSAIPILFCPVEVGARHFIDGGVERNLHLEIAIQRGARLIVAVNSDDSVRRVKGPPRPIMASVQRRRILAGLACVDAVTEFDEATPHNLLRLLRPDVLVKGANYTIDGVVGREMVEEYGGEVKTVALAEGKSTTGLMERIRAAAGS